MGIAAGLKSSIQVCIEHNADADGIDICLSRIAAEPEFCHIVSSEEVEKEIDRIFGTVHGNYGKPQARQ